MDLSISCPICCLEDESMEHYLLHCARARLIRRMAGSQTWEGAEGPWLSSFLDVLYQSSVEVTGRLAYIAYQTWLSRNSLVFQAKVIPADRVLERVVCVATEYH